MTETSAIRAIDSLCANEFALEIDGERVSGIFRISGLQTFKLDEEGNRVRSPFIVSKMVQRDGNNAFNKWLRETVAATGDKRPTRSVAIVAIDDGVETRRWTAEGAWISEVHYSDFDSASFEMVEEVYTIHYDKLVESWPATENLE
ncbi:MAG: hypothetical protein D6712_18575 [Chloroflexi bacterium]|nr:MAG: hypothetical protein D6712_18575 [Chloroflexota bacterium]